MIRGNISVAAPEIAKEFHLKQDSDGGDLSLLHVGLCGGASAGGLAGRSLRAEEGAYPDRICGRHRADSEWLDPGDELHDGSANTVVNGDPGFHPGSLRMTLMKRVLLLKSAAGAPGSPFPAPCNTECDHFRQLTI